LVKITGVPNDDDWRRDGDCYEDMSECDDPDCKSCGGTGFIAVCKACEKPLVKHTYEEQIVCVKKLTGA